MQVRRGTGRVSAFDVRDQQASAGHRDTLPEARDMLVMCTPPMRRSAHNWGALHCSRIEAQNGPYRLGTRRLIGGMFLTLTTSCAVTWAGRTASPVRLHPYLNNM